jgi:hypothetical protein
MVFHEIGSPRGLPYTICTHVLAIEYVEDHV